MGEKAKSQDALVINFFYKIHIYPSVKLAMRNNSTYLRYTVKRKSHT